MRKVRPVGDFLWIRSVVTAFIFVQSVGWQGHLIHEKLCHLSMKASLENNWRKKMAEGRLSQVHLEKRCWHRGSGWPYNLLQHTTGTIFTKHSHYTSEACHRIDTINTWTRITSSLVNNNFSVSSIWQKCINIQQVACYYHCQNIQHSSATGSFWHHLANTALKFWKLKSNLYKASTAIQKCHVTKVN